MKTEKLEIDALDILWRISRTLNITLVYPPPPPPPPPPPLHRRLIQI